MKITDFSTNKEFFNVFRSDLNDALKGIETKYGIKLNTGSISYSTFDFSMKLKGKIESNEAVSNKKEKDKDQWDFACKYYNTNLKPEWFGKTFNANGKNLTIAGFNPKAKKNPINLKDSNGKGYKASASMVSLYMSKGV